MTNALQIPIDQVRKSKKPGVPKGYHLVRYCSACLYSRNTPLTQQAWPHELKGSTQNYSGMTGMRQNRYEWELVRDEESVTGNTFHQPFLAPFSPEQKKFLICSYLVLLFSNNVNNLVFDDAFTLD